MFSPEVFSLDMGIGGRVGAEELVQILRKKEQGKKGREKLPICGYEKKENKE